MNRKRARIVVAAALAVAVVAAGAAFAVLRGKNDGSPTEQTAFCWGTLARGDVTALSVSPVQRYSSEEGPLNKGVPSLCQVGEGLDSNGGNRRVEFRMMVTGLGSGKDVWHMADDIAGVSDVRAPIPGVPGWANKRTAGVLLPLSCRGKLGVGGAAYMQLNAEGDQEDSWRDGRLQKRMTDVLMKAATGLARQLGCSEPSFKSHDQVPHLLQEQTVDTAEVCGLPGFTAPAKAATATKAAKAAKEYVTGGDFRLWSCSLGSGTDATHFTVTQDPLLLALHDAAAVTSGRDSDLLTCGGRKTLVQDDSGDSELEREFRAAVARRGDCS
ncbi:MULTISPECIES: hypothetical protein [Streptomyces]|uniref:hypothetical protein n=1 Tax=Streptomyces TaxID=1883 RepID=UPI0021A2DE8B|nr:hypothetical protein [Streptomyces atratus]MCT2546444.1 hypothetical protein [Streptomyces atratus]